MITPQEYAAQEVARIKSKHETAYERAMLFLEERVRGAGVYKLEVDLIGGTRPLQVALDPEMLALVAQDFATRLQKAGWRLYASGWGIKRWWRAGYIEFSVWSDEF